MPRKTILILLCLLCYTAIHAANQQFVKNFNLNQSFTFEENKGQLADDKGQLLPDILYYGKDKGVSVYCFKNKIAFVFTKVTSVPRPPTPTSPKGDLNASNFPFRVGPDHSGRLEGDSTTITASRMEMVFLNANTSTRVIAEQRQESYNNYYLAHCPNGVTTHSYKKLTYKNIYPSIDLVLSAKISGMEYSFIVYPGGNVNDIQIKWNGADSLQQVDGGIRYANELGYLREGGLKCFTSDGRSVSNQYKIKNQRVSFDIGRYNKSDILTIDPQLIWGTYFSSANGEEDLGGIAAAPSGNVYISGECNSYTTFITSGAYQTTYGGGHMDAFLAKFSSKDSLLWCTYYGGSQADWGTSIATDSSENICMTGFTTSPGLATSGAFQTAIYPYYGTYADADAYIVKFNSSGSRIWCTYFGGNDDEYVQAIATDKKNNIFLSGYTPSSSHLATSGAYETSFTGVFAPFLAKFTPSGGLSWSTYVCKQGTGHYTEAFSLATDSDGNVIVTGTTTSDTLVASSGAYQTNNSGKLDAFVAKFSPSGVRAWCTYFGGSDDEYTGGISTDSSGNIYLTGYTYSSSKIASSGAYQTSLKGTADAFLARFNPNGSIKWSTYFGGSSADFASALACDTKGNILIAGKVSSTGLATKGAYKTNGNSSDLIAQFSPDDSLIWATYFGDYVNSITEISINKRNDIYCAGNSSFVTSGITTPGAFQTSTTSYDSPFLVKFKAYENDAGIRNIIPKGSFCEDSLDVYAVLENYGTNILDSVKIRWSLNNSIQSTYNWNGTLLPDSMIAVKLANISFSTGKYTLRAWTEKPNGLSDSVPLNDTFQVIDTVNTMPLAKIIGNTVICAGQNLDLGTSSIAGHSYNWTSKPSGFKSTSSNPTVSPDTTITYFLTETIPATGCTKSDSAVITVIPSPAAKVVADRTICGGDSLNLGDSAIKGNTYSWTSVPKGFTSATSNPVVRPSVTTKYFLTETNLVTGCSRTDSVTITVNPQPAAKTGASKTICTSQSVLIGGGYVKNHSYSWTSKPAGFTYSGSYTTVKPNTTTIYYLTETDTITGCSKTDSVTVFIDIPKAFTGLNRPICIGSNTVLGDSALSGHTYSWTSKPAGFTSASSMVSVSPSSNTTYYLTETNTATGCTKTDSVTIAVNPLPAAKTGADRSICLGQSTTIGNAAISGNSYTWTSKPIGFSSNKSNPTVSPVITSTYYLTETVNATGCSKTDSVTVTVNPLPVADAGKDTAVCEGGSVSIRSVAQPGYTYSWMSNPSGFTSSSSSITVSPSMTTIYTLAVQNSNGCSDTDSVVVTVYPLPQPNAGQSRSICAGDTITIGSKAVSGHTYHWTSGPAGFSAAVAAPVVKPASTTIYYLTETNEYGCSKADSVIITVNPLPVAQTSGNKTICQGDKIAIGANAVSGNSYQWTSAPLGFTSNSSNPEVSPEATTTYYLAETNPSGCGKTDSVTITVNPIPQKPATGKDQKICSGDTAMLSFVPVAGMKYNWTSTSGFTSTDSFIQVHPSVTTDYVLTETNKTTGCSNTDTVRVTVVPLPKPAITGQKSFCGIDTATYTTPAHDSSTYTWMVRNGGILSGQSSSKVKVQWYDTGSVSLSVQETNGNGCQKRDSLQVKIHPKPHAGFIPYVSCAGNPVKFTDSLKKGFSYTWNFGDGTVLKDQLPIHAYAKAGKYRMKETVQNAAGCQDTLSWLITMYPVPENVQILVQHDTGRTYQFGVSDTTYMSYTWSFGDGDSSREKFPLHTFTKSLPDRVKLIVDNSFHCIAEIDTTLEVSYLTDKDSISIFPNPFSNQVHIYERLKDNTNLKLYIYDMLGHKILDDISWTREPGTYTESFDEYGLAQAMYVVKLVVNDKEVIYKKMIKLGR